MMSTEALGWWDGGGEEEEEEEERIQSSSTTSEGTSDLRASSSNECEVD